MAPVSDGWAWLLLLLTAHLACGVTETKGRVGGEPGPPAAPGAHSTVERGLGT